MKNLLAWIVQLFRDQRGEVGVDPADDPSDADTEKVDQGDKVDEDDKDGELTITPEIEPDEKDKEKDKVEAEKKLTDLEFDKSELQNQLTSLEEEKKSWKVASYEARQKAKEAKPEKSEKPFTDANLRQILADNPDDSEIQFNVLKYMSEQAAKGISDKAVNAAEMNRKAETMNTRVQGRYPTILEPDSEMRRDVDKIKGDLGLEDHPYGDYFAVGVRVFEDLPDLLDYAYKSGKEDKLKDSAEEKRKQDIQSKKLPSSKASTSKLSEGLTAGQEETAKQMGLTKEQIPLYQKLVGKKPRIVSVED